MQRVFENYPQENSSCFGFNQQRLCYFTFVEIWKARCPENLS